MKLKVVIERNALILLSLTFGVIILISGFYFISAVTYNNPPFPGHKIEEIAPPIGCQNGQVLEWHVKDTLDGEWRCKDDSTGTGNGWGNPKVSMWQVTSKNYEEFPKLYFSGLLDPTTPSPPALEHFLGLYVPEEHDICSLSFRNSPAEGYTYLIPFEKNGMKYKWGISSSYSFTNEADKGTVEIICLDWS